MDPLIAKALSFAAYKHRHQQRKNVERVPYINHPLELVEVLVVEGDVFDIEVLCAAILHDTVEDTDTSFYEIQDLFGLAISNIVREVTDDKTLPKSQRKQAQIDHAPHTSPKAKLVKLADKIVNIRDVTHRPPEGWSDERIAEYVAWSERVVSGLRGVHPVLEKLFDAVLSAAKEKINA